MDTIKPLFLPSLRHGWEYLWPWIHPVHLMGGILIWSFFFVILPFGPERAGRMGAWIGETVGPRIRRHQVGKRAMAANFPALSDDELESGMRHMWSEYGRMGFEAQFLFQELPRNLFKRAKIIGSELVEAARKEGRSILFLALHQGRFDFGQMVLSLTWNTAFVVHPSRNPWVNMQIRISREGIRGLFGYSVNVTNKGIPSVRAIHRAISHGGSAVIMQDSSSHQGYEAHILKHRKRVATAAVRLALAKNAVIIPYVCIPHDGPHDKDDDQRFFMEFLTVLDPLAATESNGTNESTKPVKPVGSWPEGLTHAVEPVIDHVFRLLGEQVLKWPQYYYYWIHLAVPNATDSTWQSSAKDHEGTRQVEHFWKTNRPSTKLPRPKSSMIAPKKQPGERQGSGREAFRGRPENIWKVFGGRIDQATRP